MDSEAQHAKAQAATLFDRLAEAEQDLGFEAARNVKWLRARVESSARLRDAAVAADERLALAEKSLRSKDREIEDLRQRCHREGLRGIGDGSGGRSRRKGRRERGGASTLGLDFRVFAAAVDARSAVERCSVAAAERSEIAGSVLAEALRATGAEDLVIDSARIGDPEDEDPGEEWSTRIRNKFVSKNIIGVGRSRVHTADQR